MAEDFLQVMKVLPDPVGSFMQGQQDAANLQTTNLQNQTQQFALQQAQQQAQQAQTQNAAYQADLGQFIRNPTSEGAANLALKYPAQQKAITDAWNMRDKSAQDADRQGLAMVYSALANKRPDIAKQYLQQRHDADTAIGKPNPNTEALLGLVDSDPDAAKGMAAYALASIPGGDDFAKVLDKVGNGKDQTHVINEGGALVDDSGKVLYQAGKSPKYMTVKNADGTESIVALPEGSAPGASSSGAGGQRYTGGWTPRAANGGDNPDNVVDNKISGAAKFLGVDPTADISGMSPMKIAQAMTLSEGGAGTIADRNNNPANLRNADGSYKQFPTKQAGLNAAAALVARKLKNGQTTVQSLVEGLPVGGAQAAPGSPGTPVYTSKGGDPASAPGDTTKTGDEYLATIPSDLANRARALLDGRTPYPSQAALRSPQTQKLLAAAQQADPSFDAATWFRRKKTAQDYSPGGVVGQTLTSGKTVINHLYELAKESDALGGSSWTLWNGAINAGRRSFSNTDIAKYDQARTLVAPELAKFLTGKAPAEGEINKHYDALDPNQGPAARKARITESIDLIAGRFGPLVQGYKDAMGRDFDIDKAVPGGKVSDKLAALERWAQGGQLEQKNAPPAGATRAVRNPKTGQTAYLINGKWVIQ